jgi:RNA polymerase sigma factor (sigma-70 family)
LQHSAQPKPTPQASVSDAGRAVLAQLLGEIAKQDEQALQRLYLLTSAKLNGLILGIVRQSALAEEVLQDTYMNVWKQAGSYNAALSAPMTWLAVIARNRAIDRLRAERSRAKHAQPLDDIDPCDDSLPVVEHMIAGQEAARLYACLSCIEQDQQRAIRAAFLEGFTYEELAKREELPLSTMKSRIRRGLMKLRACMDET